MVRLALLALAAAAAPAAVVRGVHHFKELNSRDDLQYLNMVAPDCKSPPSHMIDACRPSHTRSTPC